MSEAQAYSVPSVCQASVVGTGQNQASEMGSLPSRGPLPQKVRESYRGEDV